ncbi:11007_t:CDS:2, partial [Acaulospora morrowiae]
MQVLCRNNPRSLVLRSKRENGATTLLQFEKVHQDYDSRPQCNVRLLHELELTGYERLSQRTVFGCLGLLEVENDMFLLVVSKCLSVGEIRPNES